MKPRSIRQKIWQLAFLAVLAVLVISVFTSIAIIQVKRRAVRQQITDYLFKSLDAQTESLLPGFLMPEQRVGVDQLLSEIQNQEQLSSAFVYENALPPQFKDCNVEARDRGFCLSLDGTKIAVFERIQDNGRIFGIFLKEKMVDDPLLESLLTRVLAIIIGMITLLVFAMIYFFGKFLYRDISLSLDGLFQDIQNVLHSKSIRTGNKEFKYVELVRLEESIFELLKVHAESQKQIYLNQMASQVAHDIRSPLSALNLVIGTLDGVAEEKRILLRTAIQRINDISNGLLQLARPPLTTDGSDGVMLVALVDAIVSEKRIQYRNQMHIDIESDLSQGFGCFAKISSSELSRAVSNLMNNAVEAIADSGHILVTVRRTSHMVEIAVQDNGKGIPPDVLKRLGQRGMSFDKQGSESGSGLGLYHARTLAESAHGHLEISSDVGKGTFVRIILPSINPPSWFVQELKLEENSWLVSVDDDQTIHQIWADRLRPYVEEGFIHSHKVFSELSQFEEWANQASHTPIVYLVDYEFQAQKENGLEAISRLGIAKDAILITSRYEDLAIRARARETGVRILPKSLAGLLPITKI